jgi:hypothetical protein
VLNVCCLLFLATATGVPSYFFHPKSLGVARQNSAVAMSHYTSAPLAVCFIPIALFAAAIIVGGDSQTTKSAVAIATSAALWCPIVLLFWLMNLHCLARRAMPHLKSRGLFVVLGTVFAWAVVALLTLLGLPLLVLFVCVFVYSLL